MAKIKIISNPYQKRTSFQCWNDASGQWQDIDREHNASSRLLRDDLVVGFFPFKVKQIVDVIIEEYCTGEEKADILFEGTDDEYLELEAICTGDGYPERVNVAKAPRYLENARDILDDVINVFKELSPLVSESISDREKIKPELDKFNDVSKDEIPVCVIGNYSSGKSTFINSLVGYELLPSSDEPTTAKVYRISQSSHEDRATIEFEYRDKTIELRFSAESYKFLPEMDGGSLSEKLKDTLAEISGETIPVKLNRTLDVINTCANQSEAEVISDLIKIEAPFDDDGLWGKIRKKFVLFDTPGSNSASNVKHYQVLKKAMEGLSNGLPIFVSEYDSLDSTDNDKLYQDINNMEELDNRFTLIIVNKADTSSLKKDGYTEADRERILSLAIPRKLYSGGIYFVSSIMGLGAKNDENFLNDHNAEVFEDQKNKYVNPSSRFYKRLYRYNILPEQIRRKYDALSENHKNLIYANSGLYSVEQAIETFANIYSSYNKCQQSQMFLGKIIQITTGDIANAKQKREEYRDRIHANLEKEKQLLIDRLKERSAELHTQFVQSYPTYMEEHVNSSYSKFTHNELKEQEEQFRDSQAKEKDLEKKQKDAVDSLLSLFSKTSHSIVDEFKSIIDKFNEWQKTKKEADEEASDDLINFIREAFTAHVNMAQALLETQSRTYWAQTADQLKQELSQIVTNSTALDDEKRNELASIIIEYRELAFENRAEKIFDKAAFRQIFGDPNRLNTIKLAWRYNTEMQKQVEEIYYFFEESHAESFDTWMESLLDTIIGNIVEFSPQLHNQAEIIREETMRIAELEEKKQRLNEYAAQLKEMMAWKEA